MSVEMKALEGLKQSVVIGFSSEDIMPTYESRKKEVAKNKGNFKSR